MDSAITLTVDHPAWQTCTDDVPVRLVEHHGAPWLAFYRDGGLHLNAVRESTTAPPSVSVTSPEVLPSAPAAAALVQQLAALGSVHRLTNPSLWDAITTAILRQVVRAAQARKVYRQWCRLHGRTVDTPVGPLSLAPTPETVLDLPDEAFAEAGTKFHRPALRAAAEAYLEHAAEWREVGPDDLVKALASVHRIGPWTASAAAADVTGDFSVYPHSDLAVRTWAGRAAPSLQLPDAERAFAAQWHSFTGHDRTCLHALTLFTLTWGTHARTDQHTAPPLD